MDHIGFRAPDLNAFTANVDKSPTNIHLGPKPVDFELKVPHGSDC
jgi:hypothetical protein